MLSKQNLNVNSNLYSLVVNYSGAQKASITSAFPWTSFKHVGVSAPWRATKTATETFPREREIFNFTKSKFEHRRLGLGDDINAHNFKTLTCSA